MGRMDEIDAILEQFVAQGQNTEHKILGASFVVTTPKGIIQIQVISLLFFVIH